MIDIMFSCPDETSYISQMNALQAQGYDLKYYFTKVELDGKWLPGGWVRLCVNSPIPPNPVLESPLVEYRFSEKLNGWTSDGLTVSALAKGIHDSLQSQGLPE